MVADRTFVGIVAPLIIHQQYPLVSHWPVFSDAAVAITTRMLKEARKPGIGRSEAHRLAMMALIEDTDHPHYAHPMFWAPFVVVGEGGAALG